MRSILLAAVATLALSGAALADKVVYTAPGGTLVSSNATISHIEVGYDENGAVGGKYSVSRVKGDSARVVGRFRSLGDAYNYALSVNAKDGPFAVGSYGSGIVVTNQAGNYGSLPDGVAGIVKTHRTTGIGWFRDSTQVIRDSGDEAEASLVSEKSFNAGSKSKSSGGGFFH